MKKILLTLTLLFAFTVPAYAANEVLNKTGTQLSFADHAADFTCSVDASCLEMGTPTDVQLDLTSVADTAARESAKFDFGATRAMKYSLTAAIEMAATPVTGEIIEFYLSSSPDDTAASANPGYATGSDAAFTGTPGTLAEAVSQMIFIGAFVCSADATTTIQIQQVGTFNPSERYGTLIVKNESGAAFHSDAVETNIIITPIITEVQ